MIVFGAMVPHPPIIVPGVGKGEEARIAKTTQAMERLAADLAKTEPDTIIVITPHTLLYPDMFNICGMGELFGNFQDFNDKEFEWEGKNDLDLAREISDQAEKEGIPALLYDNGEAKYQVDHGVLVPFYFFKDKLIEAHRVLPIGYTYGSRSEHYSFGQVLSEVSEKSSERVAIIASGDLSHRLMDRQADANIVGEKFDREFLDSLKKRDEYAIVNMDHDLVEGAGECGYKSALILLGALSNRTYEPEVYSYEGPFGVGYGVVNFNVSNEDRS